MFKVYKAGCAHSCVWFLLSKGLMVSLISAVEGALYALWLDLIHHPLIAPGVAACSFRVLSAMPLSWWLCQVQSLASAPLSADFCPTLCVPVTLCKILALAMACCSPGLTITCCTSHSLEAPAFLPALMGRGRYFLDSSLG